MPLLTEGRVTEGSANKRSKQYRSYGSSPGKKGVKENTKSSHSDNSIIYIAESISPQPSVSSVLPQANPVPGYAIDVIMGPLHDPPLRCTGIYPSFDLFAACASRRTYLPFRSPAAVVSSTHFLPSRQQPVAQYVYSEYTSTSRRNDPSHTGHGSTNHRMGILHSPCQSGILRRYPQLLLPCINTEEMVKLLVDRRKEKSLKVQLDVLVCYKFYFIKVCRFFL